MSQADPFLQVQEDVLASISSLRALFASHVRICSIAKSPSNPELKQSRADLDATLSSLDADLEDLSQSVQVIEHDPYRYGIELDELERRRRFLADTQAEIAGIRRELDRQDAAQQSSQDGQSATGVSKSGGAGAAQGLISPSAFEDYGDDDDDEHGDDYYAAMEQERQMEMMAEQDQQLDGVFRTVGNLRAQADDMGRELEEQAGIIENVDTLADRVGSKLKTGARRMGHIIAQNEDTASSCCIAVLIFVLILLLVLLAIM